MPTSASRNSPQNLVVAVTALSASRAAVVASSSSRPGAWSIRTDAPNRSASRRAISLVLRCGLLESQPPTSGTTTVPGRLAAGNAETSDSTVYPPVSPMAPSLGNSSASRGAAATPHNRAARAGAVSWPGVTRTSTPSASDRARASGEGSRGAPSTEIRTTPAPRAEDSSRDTLETENPVRVAISGWPSSRM